TGSARGVAGKTTDTLPDDSLTLAEVFADSGYRTAAFIHNSHLAKGYGFEQGLQTYQDQTGDARDIRWRALDWPDGDTDDRPIFVYLHLLDAHYPYPVPDEYATRFAGDGDVSVFRTGDWRGLRDAINGGDRVLTDSEMQALAALYDGSIRYIDDQLGMLFDALKRRGMWDNTVVCVLADHGEEFMEHGRIGHGHGLYENLLRVPWILRVPGRDGQRLTTQVSLIDLFPTLLAAAGLDAGAPTPGVERLADPDRLLPIFAEHKEQERLSYLQSYRSDSAKMMRRFSRAKRQRAVPALADLLPRGTRWEVRLRAPDDGALRATCLKTRSNEPADKPIEIKGRVRALTESTMVLAGIPLRFSSDTDFHGEIADDADAAALLREDYPIKAQGAFEGNVFMARRIKFYPPDKGLDPVIRGRIEEVEGTASDGRFRIDQLWVRVHRKTDWLVADLDLGKDRLERDEVAFMLESGSEEAGRAGYAVSTWTYDLASDPGENHPIETHPRQTALTTDMNELGAQLLRRRIYTSEDEAVLSAEAIEKLRAIGYVQ
ncbi:MAG: sulfatase, partial [bacterium]|nr:sulfatase [bacterium]